MTPVVRALLIANVAAFFVQSTTPWLTGAFAFVPYAALARPWTIVTYMFLHGGLTHILFNMLALFFFGPRVESRIGSREFGILYFLSGISGALLSLVLSPASPIIGASAGVFGVSLAFAYFWPDERILIWGIIPVPARMLVIITTIISLYSGFAGSSGVAHFAHLGGYAGAFAYLKWLDRKRSSGRREFERKLNDAPKIDPRQAERYKRIERDKLHELNREEVDRLLDKISARGVDSLTAQERLFLSNFVPPDDRKPMVS